MSTLLSCRPDGHLLMPASASDLDENAMIASQSFPTPPSFCLHQCSVPIISHPSTRPTCRTTTLECVCHFSALLGDICTVMPCQLWGDPSPMPSSPVQGYNPLGSPSEMDSAPDDCASKSSTCRHVPDEETLSPNLPSRVGVQRAVMVLRRLRGRRGGMTGFEHVPCRAREPARP
jgi:hypothetical protein